MAVLTSLLLLFLVMVVVVCDDDAAMNECIQNFNVMCVSRIFTKSKQSIRYSTDS